MVAAPVVVAPEVAAAVVAAPVVAATVATGWELWCCSSGCLIRSC